MYLSQVTTAKSVHLEITCQVVKCPDKVPPGKVERAGEKLSY